MFRGFFCHALSVVCLVACGSGDDSTNTDRQGNGTSGSGGVGAGGTPGGGGAFPGVEGNFLGSCDTRAVPGISNGQCRDWVGNSTADLEFSCNGFDGVYGEIPCLADGRVGTCTLDPVSGASAIYGYYTPEYSAGDAENHCDGLGGLFRPEATGGEGGATNGGAANGGAANGGASTTGGNPGTGGSQPCPPECFRAYECVQECGDEPVSYGCCPCPDGMIDTIQCR